jgi:competence protein ComEC
MPQNDILLSLSTTESLLKEIQFESMLGSLPSNHSLLADLSARKVPSIPCRHGQYWVWDRVEFYIWHPDETSHFTSTQARKPNEMSCVLEVRNLNTSFWLTGDVEKQGEAEIVERLHVGYLQGLQNKELIFMAPHHGSKTSSSLELLKKLAPDQAFAQNGYRNRYGHAHPTVMARYESLQIPFHQTPQTGMQVWRFSHHSKKTSQPEFLRRNSLRIWHRPSDQTQ